MNTTLARKRTKTRSAISEERIESKSGGQSSGKSLAKATLESFWKDFLQESVTQTLPEQVLGKDVADTKEDFLESKPIDLVEGEEYSLKTRIHESVERQITPEHKEYFRKEVELEEVRIATKDQEQSKIDGRIQTILLELDKLKKSSTQMKILLKEVTTNVMPINAGRYHESFFEWVLIQVKQARERIDEGMGWTRMFASRKSQKKYWNMYKKHGTTFGLSHERTAATQTG